MFDREEGLLEGLAIGLTLRVPRILGESWAKTHMGMQVLPDT